MKNLANCIIKKYNQEFQGQEYIAEELASNCDRARNNYLMSFSEDLKLINSNPPSLLRKQINIFLKLKKKSKKNKKPRNNFLFDKD